MPKEVDLTKRMSCDRIKMAVTTFTPTPVKQEDQGSAFHDTIGCAVVLTTDAMKALLSSMGIPSPEFIENLPDEVSVLPLPGMHFYKHRVKFWHGASKIFEQDDTEIYNFKLEQEGDETFKLTFQFKGIPSATEHARLEKVVLDAKAGLKQALSIMEPQQEDMDLEEAEQENTDGGE